MANMAVSVSNNDVHSAPLVRLMEDEQQSILIKQGAEAKVYITNLFPKPQIILPTGNSTSNQNTSSSQSTTSAPSSKSNDKVLLKYRFPKTYRHPLLTAQLTSSRTIAEARALIRCARVGVHTPKILCVDEEQGVLGLEIIDGYSVRELLGGGSEGDDDDDDEGEEEEGISSKSAAITTEPLELLSDEEALTIMTQIGIQLARMHQAHIIHGDLTTSNMMVRRSKTDPSKTKKEVILIDFGLSLNSTSAEDKAVDLYVLQRAFASTHPNSDHLFETILNAYENILINNPIPYDPRSKAEKGTVTGPTHWKDVKRKLDDVRLRGRKRSMVG